MEAQNSSAKSWTTWFEIPVNDMDRAQKFYESVFDTQIQPVDFGGFKMGIFPHKQTGCALCWGPDHYVPSDKGVLVYMDASPDLSVSLAKVEAAGGKVLRPKSQISETHGYMAVFLDTEGNRMAMHSMK